jgi:alcohol dehydrogenase
MRDGHRAGAENDDLNAKSLDAMAGSLAGLRPDGRLVLMGFENKPPPIHPGDLIMRRVRILGSQQNDREYLHEALQIAAAGKVKVMTETYALDEITKAYERVAEGKVRFRAVITRGN